MNFQDLKKVESANFYLDVAYGRASKAIDAKRNSLKTDRLEKSKQLETLRMQIVRDNLTESLKNIIRAFPDFEKLDVFYQELVKCTLDFIALKKSLGALSWASTQIDKLFNIYRVKIKKTRDIKIINSYRKEFYGRTSSVMKQIRENLNFLDEARKIMRDFPSIKTSIPTICIYGFPNVGKSTLLAHLTGASPEINSYPFTTKSINLGYIDEPPKKLQLIDTPGLLNRNRMNKIEYLAYLVITHLAKTVIYVFDPTMEYPLEEQEKLLRDVKKYKIPVILYLSKSQIADQKVVEQLTSKHKDIILDWKIIKEKLLKS
jgi:nucleolar GTP-binding protein